MQEDERREAETRNYSHIIAAQCFTDRLGLDISHGLNLQGICHGSDQSVVDQAVLCQAVEIGTG